MKDREQEFIDQTAKHYEKILKEKNKTIQFLEDLLVNVGSGLTDNGGTHDLYCQYCGMDNSHLLGNGKNPKDKHYIGCLIRIREKYFKKKDLLKTKEQNLADQPRPTRSITRSSIKT